MMMVMMMVMMVMITKLSQVGRDVLILWPDQSTDGEH